MASVARYRFPRESDDLDVVPVKRLAARCGRTFSSPAKHGTARAKLREKLRTLDTGRLRYWATVLMIDHRWCGATGAGAYWAVASRCVNEDARAVLRERGDAWRRRHGASSFVVMDAGA